MATPKATATFGQLGTNTVVLVVREGGAVFEGEIEGGRLPRMPILPDLRHIFGGGAGR